MRPKIITLKAFGSEWWASFHRDAAAGRPVAFVAAQARRGIGRSIPAAELPCGAAVASLVPVRTDSAAFYEWTAFYARRGITLPRPDRVPVVYMPAAAPPEGIAA